MTTRVGRFAPSLRRSRRMPQVALICALAAPFGGRSVSAAATEATAAAPRCALTVSPADASERWKAAARDVSLRLGELEDEPDCRAVTLEVTSDDHAYLVFTTSDGRQCVRELRAPEQLAGVVDALLVTSPTAPAATPDAAIATTASLDARAKPRDALQGEPEAETLDRAPSTATKDDRLRFVTMLGGAARLSGPGALVSPSGALRVGLQAGAWEIFGFGEWDPLHKSAGTGAPAGFEMVRYAVGVGAGRRFAIGIAVLTLGAKTSVAMTHASSNDGNAQSSTAGANAQSSADPLLGAYAGLELPARSSVRLRTELGTAVVVTRVGAGSEADNLPSPWWNTSLSLGVVWEVL